MEEVQPQAVVKEVLRIFERECAKCHLRMAERGRIGPDLSGVNNQSREALLASILDPSAAIEGRYTNYLITTNDGRLYDGLLIGETSAVVTIRGEIEDTTLLRKDIEEIRASNARHRHRTVCDRCVDAHSTGAVSR